MAVKCHEQEFIKHQEWEYRRSLQLVWRNWLREFEVRSAKTEKKKKQLDRKYQMALTS
jgi:hypothetical protein